MIFSCLIAAAIFVVRRGQDTNWDLLNYHYYQGYSLINGRFSNDLAAANLQSFFNPIANALAYLALKHLSFPFSAWSILLIQLISIPAIALLAKEIAKSLGYSRSSPSTIPAVLLSLLAPLWISELGTTFFSSWTLPLLLWGIYLLLTAHKKRPDFKEPNTDSWHIIWSCGRLKTNKCSLRPQCNFHFCHLELPERLANIYTELHIFYSPAALVFQ